MDTAPLPLTASLTAEGLRKAFEEILQISDPQEKLRAWIDTRRWYREVISALDIRFSQDTLDEARSKQMTEMLGIIHPIAKRYEAELRRTILDTLPEDGGESSLLRRNLLAEERTELEQTVPLQLEIEDQVMAYQTLISSLQPEVQGESRTVEEWVPLFQNGERGIREQIFRSVWKAREEVSPEISALYLGLFERRRRLAEESGFPNFLAFRWEELKRFDYTPDDVQQFRNGVLRYIKPLADRIYERIQRRRHLTTLRPYDLSIGRLFELQSEVPPQSGEAAQYAQPLLSTIDPELAGLFSGLVSRRRTDLESRPGKTAGAFCADLMQSRDAFLFLNPQNSLMDLATILHEFGHGAHALLSIDHPKAPILRYGSEIAEVAAMSMELFGYEHFNEVLSTEQSGRLRQTMLETITVALPYMCQVDAFQSWLYAEPSVTAEELNNKWIELDSLFGAPVDWSGLESARAIFWQQQAHLFAYPMYYIEYAIAQLGALELWENYREDPVSTLNRYKNTLRLGGRKPLPVLFQTAGITFSFDEERFKLLAGRLEYELAL